MTKPFTADCLNQYGRHVVAALALLSALGVAGCGAITGGSNSSGPTASVPKTLQGKLMGGQQPIAGATVQLYAVNSSALGGPSTALLTSPVTTTAGGNFTITGLYTCPPGALVYITGTGGDPGAGVNPAIALMVGLGPCSGLTASTFVNVNELTTIASVYALAPFMADLSHVGADTAHLVGLTNAFAMINSLVNTGTGKSPGAVAANLSIPTVQLNSLADILATCIDSSASGNGCPSLFALALPISGSQPTDTIAAALNIVTNPHANVAQIYNLLQAAAPFQPTLAVPPNDWVLPIKLTGSGLSTPYGIAIDSQGNAWVTNETGNSVTEFNPQGVALSGPDGFLGTALAERNFFGAQGISIDTGDNVYVANTGLGTVTVMYNNGNVTSPPGGYALGGAIAPVDVAVDQGGKLWVLDFDGQQLGYSLTEFNANEYGVDYQNISDIQTSYLGNMSALAIDPHGNIWATSGAPGALFKLNQNNGQYATPGSPYGGFTDPALGAGAAQGLAFDAAGNAWTVGQGGDELSGFTNLGVPIPSTPVYGALSHPTGVAVDGAGTIWVTNSTANGSISEFAAGTGTPVASFIGNINAPVQIAIDGAGNIWTANSGDNSVTIFVGLAAPTITPLVARTWDPLSVHR